MTTNQPVDWNQLYETLTKGMPSPLPGASAQYRMAHVDRPPFPQNPPPNAKEASVLLLLYPVDGTAHTVLILRSSRIERDTHKGQISFPGGKREESDIDLAASALREAEEEVGVPRDSVQLVGPLTPLYIPVSNFIVHPFLGITHQRPKFILQEEEVEAVFEIPIHYFLQNENIRRMDIPVLKDLILKEVPYFDIEGRILWGATAMIMSEFTDWLLSHQGKNESLPL